jgi:two-component system, chemotaxis family, CheB/CheR fusion protein
MGTGFVLNQVIRDESGRAIDSRYLELNPAVEKLVGWTEQDTVGRLMSEKISAEETAKWVADFDTIVRTGTAMQSEHYHETLGMWFRAHISPIGGDQVALIYQNNTVEKRAEQALRESEDRQAFLLRLSDAVRPLSSPTDTQGQVTRLLRDQLNAAWTYYVDWDLEIILKHEYARLA